MNKTIYLLLLIFTTISCEQAISEADKKRVIELNDKAIEYRLSNDLEKAKEYYTQALDIDQSNISIRHQLIGIYTEQDSIDIAFKTLEEIPPAERETQFYYFTKGELYNLSGQAEKAIECYKKSLNLTELPTAIKNETDVALLVNYAMTETLSGQKEKAVNRLNKALELEWLTENLREYIETFRNEFESYQGNGISDFNSEDDIVIEAANQVDF